MSYVSGGEFTVHTTSYFYSLGQQMVDTIPHRGRKHRDRLDDRKTSNDNLRLSVASANVPIISLRIFQCIKMKVRKFEYIIGTKHSSLTY